MRRSLGLLGLLAGVWTLTGCEREPLPFADQSTVSPVAEVAGADPVFVGRWAPAPAACGQAAWVLRTDHLQSPGPLSCRLARVRETPAGYVVNSVCQAGAAAAPGRLNFTMTGQNGASGMTLDGGPFTEPLPLVRCEEAAHAASEASAGAG